MPAPPSSRSRSGPPVEWALHACLRDAEGKSIRLAGAAFLTGLILRLRFSATSPPKLPPPSSPLHPFLFHTHTLSCLSVRREEGGNTKRDKTEREREMAAASASASSHLRVASLVPSATAVLQSLSREQQQHARRGGVPTQEQQQQQTLRKNTDTTTTTNMAAAAAALRDHASSASTQQQQQRRRLHHHSHHFQKEEEMDLQHQHHIHVVVTSMTPMTSLNGYTTSSLHNVTSTCPPFLLYKLTHPSIHPSAHENNNTTRMRKTERARSSSKSINSEKEALIYLLCVPLWLWLRPRGRQGLLSLV